MRVLVIGANGQIGSELPTALSTNDNFQSIPLEIFTASRSELDLSKIPEISEFISKIRPNFIINAAAYTHVDKAESERELAFAINHLAVRAIASYCCHNDARLIHISTDYVFDGLRSLPYCEEDQVAPKGIYGESKLAGENVIRELLPQHIILRTAWVFGEHGSNFLKTIMRLAAIQGELRVVSDQTGSPTASKSIAQAIASIVGQLADADERDPRWGTYHFSGLPYVSWADFAEDIFACANELGLITSVPNVLRIPSAEYPTLAVRPSNSKLDSSKLETYFGIEPNDWRSSMHEVISNLKGER